MKISKVESELTDSRSNIEHQKHEGKVAIEGGQIIKYDVTMDGDHIINSAQLENENASKINAIVQSMAETNNDSVQNPMIQNHVTLTSNFKIF